MPSRRAVLRSLAVGGVALAGCSGSDGGVPEGADVVAGPDSRLTFEPETLAVGAGEEVTWYFDSRGHNVCGVPAHHDAAAIPDGAERFASYEGEAKHRTKRAGTTFTHRFQTPGEYRYVCIPHAPTMAGRIRVEG